MNIHDQGKNFTGIGINIQAGTNWLTRGVGPSGSEVAIQGGAHKFELYKRNNQLQPLLIGTDKKGNELLGGRIPTLKPNPRQGGENVATEVFLHGMNKNAAKNDPQHGGKDYWGSEGCQGPCEGIGTIAKITQGGKAGDRGTYLLMRPGEAISRMGGGDKPLPQLGELNVP